MAAIVAERAEHVRRYVEDHRLPFDILVDDARTVVKAYGVWHRIGIDAWNIARPALFLVDTAGLVRYAYIAAWQTQFPERAEVMEAIDRMKAGGA